MLGRFLRSLGARPEPAAGYAELVNSAGEQKTLGRIDEARARLERAAALEPGRYEAWYNLGILLFETWRLDEAVEAFEHAIASAAGDEKAADDETLRPVALSLGLALQRSGEWERARRFLESMAGSRPGLAGDCLRLALLCRVVDADSTPAESLAAHRRWAAVHADPRRPVDRRHANAPDPDRRLRVGYVSGDLRSHAVSLFVAPVLAHHDRSAFEVFCYDTSGAPDAVTHRLRGSAPAWRDISADGDAEALARIEEDGIDILVDLSGHTAHNRLDMFALKPAPVQLTWLGYRTTTGMAAMDYRLTDALVDPPGAERGYAERLMRLPHSQWCFDPLTGPVDPGPLPLLANGHVTFGSFNQFDKLNAGVIAAWARILAAVPGSRLVLLGVPLGRRRERFLAAWRDQGIDPGRLELHGYVPRAEFQAMHRMTDIALDAFPCNGGTTTCESLWMGVPVVSLAGSWGVARAGLSILSAAGLADWVAADLAGYVELARSRAADAQALAATRRGLQERLARSALMDGRAFTLALEQGFRSAWREWCAGAASRA